MKNRFLTYILAVIVFAAWSCSNDDVNNDSSFEPIYLDVVSTYAEEPGLVPDENTLGVSRLVFVSGGKVAYSVSSSTGSVGIPNFRSDVYDLYVICRPSFTTAEVTQLDGLVGQTESAALATINSYKDVLTSANTPMVPPFTFYGEYKGLTVRASNVIHTTTPYTMFKAEVEYNYVKTIGFKAFVKRVATKVRYRINYDNTIFTSSYFPTFIGAKLRVDKVEAYNAPKEFYWTTNTKLNTASTSDFYNNGGLYEARQYIGTTWTSVTLPFKSLSTTRYTVSGNTCLPYNPTSTATPKAQVDFSKYKWSMQDWLYMPEHNLSSADQAKEDLASYLKFNVTFTDSITGVEYKRVWTLYVGEVSKQNVTNPANGNYNMVRNTIYDYTLNVKSVGNSDDDDIEVFVGVLPWNLETLSESVGMQFVSMTPAASASVNGAFSWAVSTTGYGRVKVEIKEGSTVITSGNIDNQNKPFPYAKSFSVPSTTTSRTLELFFNGISKGTITQNP